MNNETHIAADGRHNVAEDLLAQTGAFALKPEEAVQYCLQLSERRKMLAHSHDRARLHTLIVEDQPFSRKLLYEILHDNCSDTTRTNAIDGWKAYLEEVPDIAFLDINMPDANSHMLAGRIKILDPLSYVVMMTASQEVNDIQMAKINHVDGFIIKPYSTKKIDECIHRFLATHKNKNMTKKLMKACS